MNALTTIDAEHFEVTQRMAKAMVASGYFKDAKDVAQAIVKIQAGSELGLPPFAAMSGIHIVQGKPVLGSNLLATLVKNDARYDYRVKHADDKACLLEWYENGQKIGTSGFTIQEAKAAGLLGKDNWKKYPSDMLFARAVSRGSRRFAPGVFGGSPVYVEDEFDIPPDNGQATNVVNPPTIEPTIEMETGEIVDGEIEPTNGNPVTVPEYERPENVNPDEEQVIMEGTPQEFPGLVCALQPEHYKHGNHVKNAMKILEYTGIPTNWPERVIAYSQLKERKLEGEAK